MIARLQRWLLAAVGALAAAFGVWALVERTMRVQERQRALEGKIKAARLAKEVRDEIEGVSDDDLRGRLDRFVRPDG